MTPRPSAVFVAVNTLLMAVAVGIAVAAWWPIYQDSGFIVMAAVSVALGSAIAILGALWRWPSAVVVPVTAGVFALFGVALAVPTQALYGVLPTLAGLTELFSSVALGWKQLLTITLPVGSYQGLLVPAYTAILMTVVVGLSAALRSRRGDVAVSAPVVLLVVGVAFGARESSWPIPLALGLLGVILLWLMWRRWYRRRTLLLASQPGQRVIGARTVVSALLVLGLAGSGAIAAVTLLPPTNQREVLRSAVEQPFDPRDYPSPLAGFRQYLKSDEADTVILTITGLPAGAHVRVATLDTYDGVVYSVGSASVSSESGSFTRVPFRYDQSEVTGEEVTLGVTVGDYSGVWLPTVGAFESITFSGPRAASLSDAFYYNDTSGTAALIGGLESGDEYSIRAVVPDQPAESALRTATAGSARVPALGAVPAELATRLETYAGTEDSAGAKLVGMLEGLRAEGYISHGLADDEPPSRSGHSADRITQLFTDQRMIGDSEQYAVAAALMATQLGFPSRVVFGFAPDRSGTVAVTGDDVSAWVEVNTAQYGWVAVDATPDLRDIPEEEPEEPSTVSRPRSVVQPPAEEQDLTDNQSPADASDNETDPTEGWVLALLAIARVLGWSLLSLGVLVSPFLLIIAAKLRRRALRRRAPTPLARIAGGWREFEDAVVDHGLTPPASATRSELASAVGGTRSLAAAAAVDLATFAPRTPSDDDAATLWRTIDELTEDLDSGRSRWERIRARISVRSLGGYSVRSLLVRQGGQQTTTRRGSQR